MKHLGSTRDRDSGARISVVVVTGEPALLYPGPHGEMFFLLDPGEGQRLSELLRASSAQRKEYECGARKRGDIYEQISCLDPRHTLTLWWSCRKRGCQLTLLFYENGTPLLEALDVDHDELDGLLTKAIEVAAASAPSSGALEQLLEASR